jgi:hypothetical protein
VCVTAVRPGRKTDGWIGRRIRAWRDSGVAHAHRSEPGTPMRRPPHSGDVRRRLLSQANDSGNHLTELLDFSGHGSYSQAHTAPIGRQIGCAGVTAGSADGRRKSVAGPQSHDSPARRPGKGSPRNGERPRSRSRGRSICAIGLAFGRELALSSQPGLVQAEEVTVALGREVPVRDRLRHTRFALDLWRRRARAAPS